MKLKLAKEKHIVVILLAIYVLFFMLTTRWMGLKDGIEFGGVNDATSYLAMAEAAPYLTTELLSFHHAQRFILLAKDIDSGKEMKLPFHHAQRFIPHYTTGSICWGMNKLSFVTLSLDVIYTLAGFMLIAGIIVLIRLTYRQLFCSNHSCKVSLLLFFILAMISLSSPYVFRFYCFMPAMLADLVFVLGLAIILLGMSYLNDSVRLGYAVLLGGLVIAAIGRQTTILALPGIVLYEFCLAKKNWVFRVATYIGVVVGIYWGTSWLTSIFSNVAFQTVGGNEIFGIFFWVRSGDFSLVALAEHCLRVFLPIIPIIVLMILAGIKMSSDERILLLKDKINWSLLFITLGIMSFSFLPGPVNQQQNQMRFTAMGILPLMFLLVKFFENYELKSLNSKATWVGGLGLLIMILINTLHHNYALIPANKKYFMLFQLVSIAGMVTLFTLLVSKKQKK